MYKKGYIINDDRYRKNPTICSINDNKAVRMYHLWEQYLPKNIENKIAEATDIREKYRNKLRNCTDDDLIKEYKQKQDDCTTILSEYRKKIKIANYILEDTPRVRKVIKIEKQMKELQQIDINKVKIKDRYVHKWSNLVKDKYIITIAIIKTSWYTYAK